MAQDSISLWCNEMLSWMTFSRWIPSPVDLHYVILHWWDLYNEYRFYWCQNVQSRWTVDKEIIDNGMQSICLSTPLSFYKIFYFEHTKKKKKNVRKNRTKKIPWTNTVISLIFILILYIREMIPVAYGTVPYHHSHIQYFVIKSYVRMVRTYIYIKTAIFEFFWNPFTVPPKNGVTFVTLLHRIFCVLWWSHRYNFFILQEYWIV